MASHGHGQPRKLDDLSLEERIKATKKLLSAAKETQASLVKMGMTKSFAASHALNLLGIHNVEDTHFEDYDESRTSRYGGH